MTRMDEELLLAMTEEIEGRLSLSGYEHYEVSNFAQPGRRSKHNSSYWNGVPYLGLGPGAHSFFVVKGQSGKRWENLRRPEKYIEAWAGSTTGIVAYEAETFPGVSWVESLTPQQLLQERMMTGLRCANGVDLDRLWKEGWGRPELCRIEMAIKKGWLIKSGSLVQPTKEGMKLADSLAALFF